MPETLLWTLYHRSVEARRPDAILADPRAVALLDEIDYPFAERHHEAVGMRGEGLETQFWRVDNGRVRWLTVDLPETVAVRERFLPRRDRQAVVAGSALDERWMDEVDAARGVLFTAQGLLMYFELADVERLLARLAERFRGSALVFDAVPRWLSEASRKGRLGTAGGYQPPPWLWGLDDDARRRLGPLEEVRLPRGRGPLFGVLVPLVTASGPLRRRFLSILRRRL